MKRLKVLLLPPGWDASPSQGTQHEVTGVSQGPQHEETKRYYYSPLDGMLGLSQSTQHEATWSITTSPTQGYPAVSRFTRTHLYSWIEEHSVE